MPTGIRPGIYREPLVRRWVRLSLRGSIRVCSDEIGIEIVECGRTVSDRADSDGLCVIPYSRTSVCRRSLVRVSCSRTPQPGSRLQRSSDYLSCVGSLIGDRWCPCRAAPSRSLSGTRTTRSVPMGRICPVPRARSKSALAHTKFRSPYWHFRDVRGVIKSRGHGVSRHPAIAARQGGGEAVNPFTAEYSVSSGRGTRLFGASDRLRLCTVEQV